MSVGWLIYTVLLALGCLVFGIFIGETHGYCKRLIEEMHESLDRMEEA
jgi:hypothetical protein